MTLTLIEICADAAAIDHLRRENARLRRENAALQSELDRFRR